MISNHFLCLIRNHPIEATIRKLAVYLFGIPGIEYLMSICHPSQSYRQLNVNSFLTPLSNSIWTKNLMELYKLKTQQPPGCWCVFLCCVFKHLIDMDVSENSGTPKSFILIGFSNINKPSILGYPYFWKHPYNQHLSPPPNTLLWQPASLRTTQA